MQTTKQIISTTNYLDEVLNDYGDISYLFHFMKLNPSFENIQDSILPNSIISIDDFQITNPIQTNLIVENTNPDVSLKIPENQTIFDLSLRYYGDISKCIDIIVENSNVDNLNQKINELNLIILEPNNGDVNVGYYNVNNLILTTGITTKGRAFNSSFNLSFR